MDTDTLPAPEVTVATAVETPARRERNNKERRVRSKSPAARKHQQHQEQSDDKVPYVGTEEDDDDASGSENDADDSTEESVSDSNNEDEQTKQSTSTPSSSMTVPSNDAETLDILSFKHGIPKSENLQDFLWVMTDEPHASRRKEMIKKNPELKELMGHEPRTKYIVLLLMGIQLGLAYHFREQALYGGTLQFWLVAYFVGATITQSLFLANHEISHNLAFKSFNMNKLFGIFTNIPMVLPYFIAFKHYHNEHHKNQGVDGIDTDVPTEFEARWFSGPIGKLFFMFNQTWFYAFRPLVMREQALTSWHILNAVVQITFISSTVYFIGWGPVFYLLACAHLAGSLHPIAAHFIAEHYTFAGNVETASYYGPLNYLTFNVGYHNEHHDFPTVAWSKLPLLKEKGDYDSLPYHESWTRVLWEFITNPAITLRNRVKRQDKEGLTQVKGAVGDSADYTGNWLLGTGMDEVAKANGEDKSKTD